MSKIIQILLICLLLSSKILANWDYSHSFKLKKDEIATISVIKKDYKTRSKLDGEVAFRWTLYHNDLLVLLVSYEGFKTQHILKKEYKRDSVAINLMGDYVRVDQRVFLVIKFSGFDNNIATLDANIRDPKKRVEVIFKDPY